MVVVVAGALFIAACGSDSNSSSDPNTSSPSGPTSSASNGDSDVLGTPNKATGTPLKVGYLNEGKNAALDFTDEQAAFEATVKYINEYLGGIGGHPLEPQLCQTNADPTQAKACGDEFVSAQVPVVLSGITTQVEPVAVTLKSAGIPIFAYGDSSATLLSTEGNANLINSLGIAFGGGAKIAQEKGNTKAAMFVLNVPELSSAAPLAIALYKNVGAELDLVPVGTGTDFSDMTAKVNAALAKNPDQIAIVGQDQFTAAAIRAARDAGFQGTTVIIGNTVTPEVGQAIGGFQGVDVITTTTTDPSDPDQILYNAIMDKYSPSTGRSLNAPAGFELALSFYRTLEGMSGEFTTASYEAALAAMSPTPLPLGGGITFQCNGTAVQDPLLKERLRAICTSQVLHATLDKDGEASEYEVFDLSGLLKLS